MLIRVRSLPAEDFVPARVLRAVQVSGRLVDRVADADATVRVHPREPVVLRQLGLSGGGEEHVVCRERGGQLYSLRIQCTLVYTEKHFTVHNPRCFIFSDYDRHSSHGEHG